MKNHLTIQAETGLLEPVARFLSPHQDERPEGTMIDMIVVHGISLPPGQFGNSAIIDFFCGSLNFDHHPYFKTINHLKVSAHLLINRVGEILQFVPFTQRAWHAGESQFQCRTRCNDFSIGIELEGSDDVKYEEIQYQQLAQVIKLLQKSYPAITPDRIVGHEHIAPGRKTDPGPFFNWEYLRGLL